MYLYLNTSLSTRIVLALINNQGKILKFKKIKAFYQQSEKLLSEINKLVVKIKNLKGIIVVVGPGSFTSLRVGLTTANTLAWSLKLPLTGIENKNNSEDKELIKINFRKILKQTAFKQVLPQYGQKPNITL